MTQRSDADTRTGRSGGEAALVEQFGHIDIYLFDQLLRQRIVSGMRVLDVGCGDGRNVVYLLRAGYEVFAVDAEPRAVAAVQALAAALAPALPASNFRVEPAEAMSFDAGFADVVLASALLHFARDDQQFAGMLQGMWRALRPGGLFFARLASTIGIEDRVVTLSGRRHRLPDGSDRYLVDEALLMEWSDRLGGDLMDPIKTTVVQHQRSMTTWVLRKR